MNFGILSGKKWSSQATEIFEADKMTSMYQLREKEILEETLSE